jgi:uncharacterized OsmC-like protein
LTLYTNDRTFELNDRTYKEEEEMSGYAEDVRVRQEALRTLYAERPDAATIHKRVRTGPGGDGDPFHSAVVPENLAHPEQPYGVEWRCGPDEAVGGLHDVPNPGELLCGALAGCFDGTVRMIAALLGVELEHLEVEARASMDVRGALAIKPDVRVGLQAMQLDVQLRTAPDTPPHLMDALARAAERYCITLDTLRAGVPVEVTVETPTTAAAL